jgi:hypothetical protein
MKIFDKNVRILTSLSKEFNRAESSALVGVPWIRSILYFKVRTVEHLNVPLITSRLPRIYGTVGSDASDEHSLFWSSND